MKWSENDVLFKKELEAGHQWQKLPGQYFRLHGLTVEIPKLSVRADISQSGEWMNTVDMYVNGLKVEVKSRNEPFTNSFSFPYDTIIVDTVKGYDGKVEKPFAYVMVSRPTGGMLFLDGNDAKDWIVEEKFDRIRKIADDFYLVPSSKLRTLDLLVQSIREKTGG